MAVQKTFNSFSGVDITPIFQGKPIGEIQAISYSINREKAPVYTMGKADPRSFARGKRGIAGSLIFIVFDKHSLLDRFQNATFSADKDEKGIRNKIGASLAGDFTLSAEDAFTQGQADSSFNQELVNPWYADQIPPFDIVLAAANEYGAQAVMKIFGVELLNENSGVSIDDIVTEQQYTYIARSITPWYFDDSSNATIKKIKESIEG
jgi:hypothetical protein